MQLSRIVRRQALLLAVGSVSAFAVSAAHGQVFHQGDLVVSSETYDAPANTITVGQNLPGGSPAITNGSFYQVFDNTKNDASFSVSSPYTLLQYTPGGTETAVTLNSDGSVPIPTSVAVGSFSSKSEGALNLSADGHSLTLLGYNAPDASIDVSNTNTPGAIDPTNPDTASATSRTVVEVNALGTFTSQNTNAFSGDNGRAVVDVGGGTFIGVGNSNNGTGTAANIVNTAGVQVGSFGSANPSQVGPFTVAQTNPATGLPYATGSVLTKDKTSKDDNFRGETVFNNTLYVTKGSGSNGINTVYQVGTTGGISNIASNPSGTTINVLKGFPTAVNRNPTSATGYFPFGIWFANPTTLYVADEGDGVYSDAATGVQTNAGLEKWTLNTGTGTWVQDYTLQAGLLGAGHTYTSSGFPYTLTAGGLRNITGTVNADGTVTIYGVTASLANLPGTGNDSNFDQGATPDQLVAITDTLANTTVLGAAAESFQVLQTAADGQVFRGVSFAPTAVPEPTTLALLGGGSCMMLVRRRKQQR